jgi:hypothetical protein
MSAREAWSKVFARSFGTSTRVLWIGDKRLAPAGAEHVRDLSALPASGEHFDGIGWVTRADVRAGLTRLRPRLSDGGSLILVLDESLLMSAMTRAFRLAPRHEATPLNEACEALVLSGFEEPCVVQALRPRGVVAAKKPNRPCALDAFFAQPTA